MVYDVAHLEKWHPWQRYGNKSKKMTMAISDAIH
jgi:hypothetical protein